MEQSREEAAWWDRSGEKAQRGVGGELKQRSREINILEQEWVRSSLVEQK